MSHISNIPTKPDTMSEEDHARFAVLTEKQNEADQQSVLHYQSLKTAREIFAHRMAARQLIPQTLAELESEASNCFTAADAFARVRAEVQAKNEAVLAEVISEDERAELYGFWEEYYEATRPVDEAVVGEAPTEAVNVSAETSLG